MFSVPSPWLSPLARRCALLILLVLILAGSLGTVLHSAAQDDAVFAGPLAYTGSDGNVYVLAGPDAEPVALTEDARPGLRTYHWPTWATDGRLAYFAHEAAPVGGLRLRVFITPPGSHTPALAYESTRESLTYAYWSPGNCPMSENCRDLAVLTTTSSGLQVLRVRDEAPDFSADVIGTGGPFYYSYSPDGSRMIWQRFGVQLDLYDTAADEIIRQLPDVAGTFQAPMWSPVDDRLLFSVRNADNRHDLVIADGENRQVLAADQDGTLWFAWSPDGQYVAYKLDLGPLHIVEAATGALVTRSSLTNIVAFLWSPDGQRLAYLTVQNTGDAQQVMRPAAGGPLAAPVRQNSPALLWHVLDLANGSQWSAPRPFLPSQDMLYYLLYFDQFAQSHRLWSPDSRYLVYSALDETAVPTLFLLDTAAAGSEPLPLVAGDAGVWSYTGS